MSKLYDVVIAGAGPIGLLTACELALSKVSVLVLERDLNPESPWKSLPLGLRGMNMASVEALNRRGLSEKALMKMEKREDLFEKKPGFQFGGHFAGLVLNAEKLDMTRWKYRIPGPGLTPGGTTMELMESAFLERAEGLGVTVVRGKGVTGISQDDNGVTVEAGGETFSAKWLVGCDGGRSSVRRAAGFDFVGSEPEVTGYVIQADVDHPEKLKKGFNPSKGGMYISGLGGTIYFVDFDGGAAHRTQELTLEYLQGVMERVTGFDVKITKIYHASTFTDRSNQATSYRKGRVLLAGDAAHIHAPLGAQGLNLGIGDAMNLGWKLAATVVNASKATGSEPAADLELLDTYEKERLPVGAAVLEWSRAQVATLRPDLIGAALQKLMIDLIDTADGTNFFISRIWGLSQRYDFGDEQQQHDLVGRSAPDFEFNDGSRLSSKLEGGRGLLVDFEDDAALKELAGGYEAKVDYVAVGAKDRLGLRSLLIRPDGVVAWIAEEKPDLDGARASFKRWFGLGS